MATGLRTSRVLLRWRGSIRAPSLRALALLVLAAALFPAAVAGQSAPGGLYLGYYYEDPVTNPEDPFPGALFLVLPSRDGAFAGTMYFTHLGCQPLSAGSVRGEKLQRSLSGRWGGRVDNTNQTGVFTGIHDPSTGRYAGIYTVDRGKQFLDLRACVPYVIAPNGRWELFPMGTSVPASFEVSIRGDEIEWSPVAGATAMLVAVVDRAKANAGDTATAVRWQAYLLTGPMAFDATHAGIAITEGDIVMVTAFDSERRRIAFGSRLNVR